MLENLRNTMKVIHTYYGSEEVVVEDEVALYVSNITDIYIPGRVVIR